jgi:transposase
MAAVQDEFGEPVGELIRGLRAEGHSWGTVAGVLGVSASTLQEWRRALGLELNRHAHCRRAGKEHVTPGDRKARAAGYPSLRAAIRYLRLTKRLTLRQVAQRLGVHYATVSWYSRQEAPGLVVLTAEGRARRVQNLRAQWGHRPHDDHPWRQDEDVRRAYCKRRR